jgi:hypothetical protein
MMNFQEGKQQILPTMDECVEERVCDPIRKRASKGLLIRFIM